MRAARTLIGLTMLAACGQVASDDAAAGGSAAEVSSGGAAGTAGVTTGGDTAAAGGVAAAGAAGFAVAGAGAAGGSGCTGAPSVSAECAAAVPEVVTAFVPSDAPVHCTDAATFCFEGRQVRLVHVEYGELNDCWSGCFASNLCAIEDPAAEAPALFYASWTTGSEAPRGIDEECPDLSRSETWPDCVPSGLRHPLVVTEPFRDFAAEQEGVGPLRYCVNRYVLQGWP